MLKIKNAVTHTQQRFPFINSQPEKKTYLQVNLLKKLTIFSLGYYPTKQECTMAETWNKKEREKKKQQEKKEKAERKQERKDNAKSGSSLESMMAYLDENGNLVSTPPDPKKKIVINVEDIEIGVAKQAPVNPEDLIRKGVVTLFNDAKGYGFIRDIETQESLFVHANSLSEQIKEQNKVSFEVEMGPKGANAVNVKLIK